MRRSVTVGLLALVLAVPLAAPQELAPQVRFEAVDVFIDTGGRELAAYQFELVVARGSAKIVGVEGGTHPAFEAAPYYDPAALHGAGRIVIAAFSTGEALPAGRMRVARLHLQRDDDAELRYEIRLEASATSDGTRIPARAECKTVSEEGSK